MSKGKTPLSQTTSCETLAGSDDTPCGLLCYAQSLNHVHGLKSATPLQPHGLKSARLFCPWGFSRQEYWSGLPCPHPGDLPNPGIKPIYPALVGGFFTPCATWGVSLPPSLTTSGLFGLVCLLLRLIHTATSPLKILSRNCLDQLLRYHLWKVGCLLKMQTAGFLLKFHQIKASAF